MNKIFKGVISGLLSVGLVVPSLPTFASEKSELLYSQSFNSVTTNEVPANLKVVGRGARVSEYADKEKALKFELTGGLQMAEVETSLSGKFFISFDISSDGKLNGGVKLKNSSGGEFSVVQFVKGMLCTHNGGEVTGINKKMTNVTIEFNVDKSRYSLYVGGKCMKRDFYVGTFSVKQPTSVAFELGSSNGGTALLDNINIGTGKAMESYPKDIYDDSFVEYYEESVGVDDRVFTMTDFKEGKRISGAYQAKDNTLQQFNDETGEGVCLFKRTGSQDFHLDMNAKAYESDSLVYQYDVKLLSTDVQFKSTIKSKTDKYFDQFAVKNGSLIAGNAKAGLPVGEWQTISTVYNVLDSTFDVYLNYELLAKGLPVDYRYLHEEAMTWRIHVNRSAGDDAFYVDNMVVYGGTEPRANLEYTESNELQINATDRPYASDKKQTSYLGGKVSYHLRSGVLYKDGTKTIVEPIVENGTTLVPLSFFETAFGSSVSYDAQSGEGKIDSLILQEGSDLMTTPSKGVTMPASAVKKGDDLYVPLRSVVVDGLGKNLAYDNTTISYGMIVISDSKISLPTGDDLQELNNFALYLRPDSKKIIEDYNASPLKGVHPRVMADKSDFDRIRNLMQTDVTMSRWARGIINTADGYVADPTPLIFELRDGVRLWYVSLDMVRNMTILGMAYQLTGDPKYAQRAWVDLESVSNFPSWHPEHHIDVAGLAVGVAIGYDWMYDAFTTEQRTVIEKGAYKNGFYDYVDGYQGRNSLMSGGLVNQANHNQVMNGGGGALGVAFLDVYPNESAYCIAESLRCLEFAIDGFAPEGSWFEGIGYAGLALEYMSYQLSSIKKTLGTVYTMDASEGVDKIPLFYLYMQSSMGSFPYADGGSASVNFDPMVMWLCDHYGDTSSISALNKLFDIPMSVRAMLWYNPEQLNSSADLNLDNKYNDQQIVTVRDSWDRNSSKVFAGMKGGLPGANHGHMDVGKFEFYANGVRWTRDLGSDNYNLPNYFSDLTAESPRWSYYRMRAESHSTIFINPDEFGEFDPNVKAMMTRFESKPRGAIAVLDMTDTHAGKAKKAERAMYLTDNRQSLVLRDEITLSQNDSHVYWHMITEQNPVVSADGKSVKLSAKTDLNNYVTIDFTSNADFKLTTAPCEPLPTSPSPEGIANDKAYTVVRLVLTGSGNVNITAKLTPCTVDGATDVSAYDIPIASWSIPDGEIPAKPTLDRITVGGVEYNPSQKIISHIVASSETSVPVVLAESSVYNVQQKNASDFDGCTEIVVTDKNDASNVSVYRVYFKKLQPLEVDGVTERQIVKVDASAEPQSENPAISVIDRDQTTRWSAEGNQYLILDLGRVVDFDRVIMSFMGGDSRHYKLKMSVSADGVEYTQVFDGTSGGKTNDYEIFDIGLQNARFVKIEGNGYASSVGSTPGSWNSWTEVSVAKAD